MFFLIFEVNITEEIFIILFSQVITWCEDKMSTRTKVFVRLKEEDRTVLRKISEYYDVSESDAVRIAVKHLAKELGLLSS